MSDLEFFGGADASESFDPASFERFKERMKAAAAQLQAIQKQEKQQKKSEDELIKILLKFIQGDQNRDILLLVSRLLDRNVPAGFIISLLMISYEDIQKELNIFLLPAISPENENSAEQSRISGSSQNLPEVHLGDKVLPLKIKIALGNWINEINRRVRETPHKLFKTAVDEDGLVVLAAIQLATFCLRDYLEKNQIEAEYNQLKEFMDFILNDAFQKAAEELKNRKNLDGE